MKTLRRPEFTQPELHEVDPTPEEIAARCAAIQSEWSAEEVLKRKTSRTRLADFVAKVSLADIWEQPLYAA